MIEFFSSCTAQSFYTTVHCIWRSPFMSEASERGAARRRRQVRASDAYATARRVFILFGREAFASGNRRNGDGPRFGCKRGRWCCEHHMDGRLKRWRSGGTAHRSDIQEARAQVRTLIAHPNPRHSLLLVLSICSEFLCGSSRVTDESFRRRRGARRTLLDVGHDTAPGFARAFSLVNDDAMEESPMWDKCVITNIFSL